MGNFEKVRIIRGRNCRSSRNGAYMLVKPVPYKIPKRFQIIAPPQTPTPSAKIRSPFIAQPQISHHSITHKRCVESGEKCECEALSEAYISSRVDHVNSVGFDNSAKLFHVNLPEGQTSRFAKQNTSLRRKPKLLSFRGNDITWEALLHNLFSPKNHTARYICSQNRSIL